MTDIGKSPDHGRPAEIEANTDLLALREAAEHLTAAVDLVGEVGIHGLYPLLERAEDMLQQHIRHMEAREEAQNEVPILQSLH